MEKKLAEFRARRQAESADRKSQHADGPLTAADTAARPDASPAEERPAQPERTESTPGQSAQSGVKTATSDDGRDWLLDSAAGRWLASRRFVVSNVTLLKVLLWLVLLGLFVELGFGPPFFVLSLFYWLYEGLRSPAPRQPGELSAYSVFNPDCQPLLGTLTAEQLEGEMGYRPLANR